MVDRDALWTSIETVAAEFARWSAGVQAGTIPLAGAERVAYNLGYRAGRVRLGEDARAAQWTGYTARQMVAYATGYGEGRALPAVTDAEYAAHQARRDTILQAAKTHLSS